jgi:hypothetical protein
VQKLLKATMLLFGLCIALSARGQIVVSDGDFSTWTLGNVGTSTMVREAAGGNPGARLNVTTTSGVRTWGTGFKSDFSTNTALAGLPVTLSIDVAAGAGDFGGGQYFTLLIEQGGTLYGEFLNNIGTGLPPGASFSTVTFTGSMTAANFFKLSGAGAATPDLSGATATRFGFAAGNQNSGTLTQYYDNYNLMLGTAAATAVPALSQWGVIALTLLLAFGAVAALRRRSSALR